MKGQNFSFVYQFGCIRIWTAFPKAGRIFMYFHVFFFFYKCKYLQISSLTVAQNSFRMAAVYVLIVYTGETKIKRFLLESFWIF